MDRIGIGEFVRTKHGEICKVLGIREKDRVCHLAYYLDSRKGSLTPAFILKHSKNIIDLIEVGDYVNGKEVTENNLYKDRKCILFGIDYIVNEENIKTIITKEQIETMKYKVGD